MLQFRLRTLFIATTAAAVLAWALFAPPQRLGLLVIYLVYSLLPAVTVSGIVFHRGYWQAFFIGMIPWISMVSFWAIVLEIQQSPAFWPYAGNLFDRFSATPDEIIVFKLMVAIPLVIAVASGLVGVGIRWWAISAQRHSR
jgi:hypothetical protein